MSNTSTEIDIAIGAVLIAGAAVANMHQAYLIIRYKSCEGVSSLSFWLSFFASILLTVNIFVLKWDSWIMDASSHSRLDNVNHWVALAQVASGALWAVLILVVMSRYDRSRSYSLTLIVCLFLLLTLGLGLVYSIVSGNYKEELAVACGIAAIPVTAVIWVPQIVVTVKTMQVRSLSWLLLLGEMVGSFVVLVYQAGIVREPWSTWVSQIVVVVEQVVLISLYVYILVKRRRSFQELNKAGKDEEEGIEMEEMGGDGSETDEAAGTSADDEQDFGGYVGPAAQEQAPAAGWTDWNEQY